MTLFSEEWLNLREPLDVTARARDLAVSIAQLVHSTEYDDVSIQIVDLGAGTGANLRYLAPLLGGSQEWLLVDRDPSLLAAVEDRMRIWGGLSGVRTVRGDRELILQGTHFECRVRCIAINLASELDSLVIPQRGLVTGSALLDLVSEEWLMRLAHRLMGAQAFVCFSLSYDGRIDCQPVESEDLEVRLLFNRHQLGDKGFGPALGPGAAMRAIDILEECGYSTRWEISDWCIKYDKDLLQLALVDDWYHAATKIDPDRLLELQKWRERRVGHIRRGRSILSVGHADMIGWFQ